jgi:hypothetical protein
VLEEGRPMAALPRCTPYAAFRWYVAIHQQSMLVERRPNGGMTSTVARWEVLSVSLPSYLTTLRKRRQSLL